MKQNAIYCTKEQTLKAYELGAHIEIQEFIGGELDSDWFYETNFCYHTPTTEQMIGWLEDKGLVLHIYPIYRGNDYCIGYMFSCEEIERHMISDIFSTRKEATLASIDKALEYLINERK